jgi:hypothetical protein
MGKGSPVEARKPLLTLLLSEPPAFEAAEALEFIASIEPLAQLPDVQVFASGDRPLTASFSFGLHVVEVALVEHPMFLESLDQCVLASHWSEDEKRRMTGHRMQLLLYYNGTDPDPIEQYIAVYKVAGALAGPNVLGVANEPAWTAHPAGLLTRICTTEMLAICRHSPPLIFWTGFLSSVLNGDSWFFTRGYHLFGFRDLAICVPETRQVREVQDLFTEVFHYLYFDKPHVQVNDLVQVENAYYELTEHKGFADTVGSANGFYVLEERKEAEAQKLIALSQITANGSVNLPQN